MVSRHYVAFALLYLLQGSVLAYLSNFQKPYLAMSGVPSAQIGLLTSLLLLPFILKVFLGMLSDRENFFGLGFRKPYMILGLLIASLGYFILSKLAPALYFKTFAVVQIISTFGLALFDTCTDGLAVDVSKQSQQGPLQGAMMGGQAAGFIIFSFLYGKWIEHHDHSSLFIFLSVWILIVSLVVFLTPQAPKKKEAVPMQFRALIRQLNIRTHVPFLFYAIFYSICSFGMDGLVTLFLSRGLLLSDSHIGTYGSFRGIGALFGAGLAGLVIRDIGLRKTAWIALLMLGLAGFALSGINAFPLACYVGLIWGMSWAFQETTFVTISMGQTIKGFAASSFALFMMLSNLGTSIGEWLATTLSGVFEFHLIFRCFAVAVLLLPALFLPFVLPKKA